MIDASRRLRRAIELNDLTLVRRIVKCNPSLIQNPDLGDKANTSLHTAAAKGLTEIAAFLIAAGHENSEISRNVDDDTPLMFAARNGHVQVGELLINSFPRCLPMLNRTGMSALALASQQPASTTLVSRILEEKEFPMNVDARDADGNTPLHHASASGSLKALRILLGAGANPMARNNQDWMPLSYSQTVAAHVYFKNLIVEFERHKAETARMIEERERQKASGLRLVDDDDDNDDTAGSPQKLSSPLRDEAITEVLRRHWSPTERKRPVTPAAGAPPPRMDWSRALQQIQSRSRSGSGD